LQVTTKIKNQKPAYKIFH